MDEQVGLHRLLERRAEGLDELGGQVPHEADRVGHRVDAPVGGPAAARRGVEGGEQGVLDEQARARQPVEQRALARVRVADDGDRGDAAAPPALAAEGAGGVHAAQPAAQDGDARVDAAPVGLEPGLAGPAAADADAGGGPAAHLP